MSEVKEEVEGICGKFQKGRVIRQGFGEQGFVKESCFLYQCGGRTRLIRQGI